MNGATLPTTGAGPSNDKDTKDLSKTGSSNNSGAQAQQNMPPPSHPLASEILPSPSSSASGSSISADDTAVDEAFRLEESALAREEEDLAALRREEFGDDVVTENESGVEDENDKGWKARRTLRK
jgi:hypothetical protein